jgi:cyclin A
VKKVSLGSSCNVGSGRGSVVKSASTKPGQAVSRHDNTTQRQNVSPAEVPTAVQVLNVTPDTAVCNSIVPPPHLEDSVSVDGEMSACDSMKSPDSDYSNNGDTSMLSSLEGRENLHLCILKDRDGSGLFSLLKTHCYDLCLTSQFSAAVVPHLNVFLSFARN